MVARAGDAEGVAPAAAAPLPWLAAPLAAVLDSQRGHATLVHGAAGGGALQFVLLLAQALLCESAPAATPEAGAGGAGTALHSSGLDGPSRRSGPSGPCGHCGSCRLVRSGLHPDLFVLLPETLRRSEGWLLATDKPEGDDAKRKPSRQIRIDEVRALIDWSHKTSARGVGKVAVLHPADTMNLQSASALLKTLEEPPAGTRVLLTTADPAWLLPTVRSRCQQVRLPVPAPEQAQAWLAGQGVAQPAVLLAACNGRPLDALALQRAGIDAVAWAALPRAVARGHAAAMAGWPSPLALDAMQKLCHDAMAAAVGGQPSYFPAEAISPAAALEPLLRWAAELRRVAQNAEHPWNEGLLLEALVGQGAQALTPASAARGEPARGLAKLGR